MRKPAFPDSKDTLARALRLSRYARQLVDSGSLVPDPAEFERPFERTQMAQALRIPTADAAALAQQLRKLRQAVMLRVIARDLSGRASLAEVLATVSALAEETLGAALAFTSRRSPGSSAARRADSASRACMW